MKKNLRLLCLGLATAAFTASFAQAENVTDKLLNADMEKGVIGWNIKFDSHIWKKTTKSQVAKPGFHGVNNAALENWKSDATSGLTNNTISQSITGLPNGTYVFGAYVGASIQAAEENRDQVTGVELFANEASVPVATNNPDAGTKWGHTAKFNVAVNVIDGTLNVGLKAENTPANFLIWDNATLYYFGEGVDAAAALDEMAKIDMAATLAIADTCLTHKMHVDTLSLLNEQIAAGKALAGAADAYQVDEDVYWAIRLANKSIADYRGFNNALNAAKEIAAMEWTASVAAAVAELNALIEEGDAIYAEATLTRDELAAKKAALNEAAAYVELDSSYLMLDVVDDWIENTEPGTALGEYSDEMINEIVDLLERVREVLAEADVDLSAITAKHRCDSLYDIIADIQANPITFAQFPIVLGPGAEALKGYNLLDGATLNENDVVTYTSQVYRFEYPLTKIRFVVKKTGSNGAISGYETWPFFTLSSFELFDGEGNEIELDETNLLSNACHNTLNPNATDGAGIPGLFDDDPNTFFHSTWGAAVTDYHYLEVNLPEGEYSAFSFAMTARSTSHSHQFPATLEIVHVSETMAQLQEMVATAKGINPYQGTAPGFYKDDVTTFYAALAAAEALVGSDASEADLKAAMTKLDEEYSKAVDFKLNMPEAGKKYHFISAGPFFEKQALHKAITVYSDSTTQNWLWWETASADSAQQVFTFEYIENTDDKAYYAIKHEATGLYMGSLFNPENGEAYTNAFGLTAEKDTVELVSLGYGQFGLVHEGRMMHCGDHNSGNYGTGAGAYGGIYGQKSSLVNWSAGAYSASAWFIREMSALPCAVKSLSDINFQTETINLYEGINSLTLTADKDCQFSDLVVYDLFGNVIPATVTVSGANASVILDTAIVEAFSFAFTNTEAVTSVTVDGAVTKLSILQDSYDYAMGLDLVEGDLIGQYSDLSELNAALEAAKALLQNGGTDEAIQQAANDIDSAVVHLEVNYPLPDKTYFLVSALDGFKETHGLDVAIYAKDDAPAWSYVSIDDPAYRWKFIETDPLYSARVFYLQNEGTGKYMGCVDAYSTPLALVGETTATQPFRIDFHEGTIVTICDGRYSDGNLHLNGHGGGANAFGNIVYWSSTTGTASAFRIVESEMYIKDFVDAIEDVEFVDEYVAPAKKGIFDLFGRRIDAPAATGIYIVDGKKRVIKK